MVRYGESNARLISHPRPRNEKMYSAQGCPPQIAAFRRDNATPSLGVEISSTRDRRLSVECDVSVLSTLYLALVGARPVRSCL